jgi:hypothetical protein
MGNSHPLSLGTPGFDIVLRLPLADVSLKRAAWAFGCAKKGSEEERRLRELLIMVVKREAA